MVIADASYPANPHLKIEMWGTRLEAAAAPVGEDGDDVGAQLLSEGGHVEESIPQWLKPLKEEARGGPRLKPWLT